MDCDVVREAISALIDRETLPVERAELDAHLDRCPACRIWRERAHDVTRRVRIAPAWPLPAAGAAVRAIQRAPEVQSAWRREAVLVRAALVLVAALQFAITLPVLIFGSDHGAPIHVAHEMGSFDVALAVGFLLAAAQPTRARGMSVLVGAAAVLLIATAVLDLAAGRTSPSDEAPHLLAVAGWLLLGRLAALTPTDEYGGGILSLREFARGHPLGRLRAAGGAGQDGRPQATGTAIEAEPEADRGIVEPETAPRRAASG